MIENVFLQVLLTLVIDAKELKKKVKKPHNFNMICFIILYYVLDNH